MSDLLFLALAIGAFVVCWAYLLGLERLTTPKDGPR